MIEVRGLTVADLAGHAVVSDVSFELRRHVNVGLAGESGSGKTTAGLALLGHIRPGLRVTSGSVSVNGRDVLSMSAAEVRSLRRKHFAYLGQDPATSLTPTMRVGALLSELAPSRPEESALCSRLEAVGLPADPSFLRRFPHQLSGGQRQRVALARALTNDPEFLLLDEPTTGLDTVNQKRVLDEIADACRCGQYTLMIISHDLGVVARFAHDLLVMRQGELVDHGNCIKLMERPRHAYTARLVEFAQTNSDPPVSESTAPTSNSTDAALQVKGLGATYESILTGNWALSDVSFSVEPGECVAVVGLSGSGKSTLARCLVGLHAPSTGSIELRSIALAASARKRGNDQRRLIQLVPQDPSGSLNPRRRVGATLARPLRLLRGIREGAAIKACAIELLQQVELDPIMLDRFPRTLSGGEAQRVALARALAAQPEVLVCDEITSALDVSTREGILTLINDLRSKLNVAVVFIAHDLELVKRVADRVVVLEKGRVCEEGSTRRVLRDPAHRVTRSLVEASTSLSAALATRQRDGTLTDASCLANHASNPALRQGP